MKWSIIRFLKVFVALQREALLCKLHVHLSLNLKRSSLFSLIKPYLFILLSNYFVNKFRFRKAVFQKI